MATSYDTLLKQVETLTAENSSLKKELKDNSHQLCQLETEASSMKDALLQLHFSTQSMQEDIMAAHKTSEVKVTMRGSPSTSRIRSLPGAEPEMNHLSDAFVIQQELEKERFILSQQQENEEKLKAWYMNHLQDLKRRLEELPLSDHQYPMSLARQQIELEMKQLRDVMQKSLGCPEDVATRQRKRAIRLHSIDQKLKEMCTRKNDSKLEDNSRHSVQGKAYSDAKHHLLHMFGSSNGQRNSSLGANQAAPNANADSFASPYMHLSSDGSLSRSKGQMVQVAWAGGPTNPDGKDGKDVKGELEQETSSLASFNSSNSSEVLPRKVTAPQFGTKVEMVYSLLSMLGTHDKDDMSRTLLAMSSSQDSCISMRESGCLPLLIQLLHGPERDFLLGEPREGQEARARASTALHNIVHSHPNEAKRKQESRILRLLEQIRAYCDDLMERNGMDNEQALGDHNPGQAIATLMKHSFDEEYRSAICQIGGLQAIAELLQIDFELNADSNDQYVITLRRYSGMALTNLTFGDVTNKALLCSMKGCMRALVAQLKHENEDLRQVAASVLRNLSWRADMASKRILRDIGAVPALMKCALEVQKESSLKSVLSALWNLSAHCTENKADICAVEGALNFLVGTLTYKSPTRNWAVVENGGGILRNVSSHIATNEQYRKILRDNNCLQILLRHLKSSSLTIVSNACGTLWNLSARNKEDQDLLWELGAVSMLKNLVHSKHKVIAMGSSAALRNLMSARPDLLAAESQKDGQPTLHVRKQRALEAEIDKNLRDSHLEGADRERKRYSYSFPRQGTNRNEGFPSSRTMPSMQGNPDQSPVPQRIPIWSQTSASTPEPEGVSSPRTNRHQGDRSKQNEVGSITYQPYGINLQACMKNSAKQQHQQHLGNREVSGDGSPATSRMAKVMQEVAQHATTSSDTVQEKLSTPAYSSSSVTKDSLKTVPSHCVTKENNSSLTNRSKSYSFGIEGQHMSTSHRASQESIHSDIYPSSAHERSLAWKKVQGRTSSAENGLNMEKPPNIVEHKAVVHQPPVEDIGQEADSIINFSLKYSEEDLNPSQQGLKPLKEPKQESQKTGSSGEPNNKIPPEWCNKYNEGNSGAENGIKNRFETISTNLPNIHFISYSEGTDLFHDEQPTNFANKYSHEEPECGKEVTSSASKKGECASEKQLNQRVHEDGMRTYCVEDTPVVFSRCSSLSSLEDDENAKDGTDKKAPGPEEQEIHSPKGIPPSSHTPDTESHIEEPDCHVEDTPLIFSRCSSVSSLSSVEVQDICDDKSSVCSDSRRASEVVSPSDLPDSPSETMPQSPKRIRTPRQGANDVKPPVNPPSLPRNTEENVVSYKVEGQTVDNSCATSLSALTIDDDTKVAPVKVIKDGDGDKCVQQQESKETEKSHCQSQEHEEMNREEITEQEEDILNACINSAIPSKKVSKLNKSKLGHLRKNGRGSLPSLVNREPDGAMDGVSSFKTEGTPVNFSTSTSLSDLTIEDIEIVNSGDGNLRVKNPSKVPVGSRNESTGKGIHDSERESHDKACDDSLLEACINSAMPKSKGSKGKSGIPKKSRGIPKLKGGKSSSVLRKRNPVSELRYKSPSPIPEMTHETRSSCESQEHEKWPGTVSPAPDTVQTFCVEGTPGMSKASSWGDLTESLVQEDIINGNAPQEERRSSFAGAGVKKPLPTRSGLVGPASKLSAGSTPMDSPKLYGVEGTPLTFSRSDSLSSLSCDEDADLGKAKADMKSSPSCRKQGDGASSQDMAGTSNIPTAVPSQHQGFYDTPMDSPKVFMVEGTPLSFSRKESLSSISCDEMDGEDVDKTETSKSAKECLAEKTKDSSPTSQSKKEPGALGREFLQRQLNSDDPFEKFQDGKEDDLVDGLEEDKEPLFANQKQNQEPLQKPQNARDKMKPFNVEDTPVCFSRNSSLSSLSIDSDEENDEQALLEQCISSGMPKSKEKTFHIESGGKEKKSKSERKALNKTWDEDDLQAACDEIEAEKKEEEEKPMHRGPRISKPGESSQKASEGPKAIRGGKKTYRSPITGQTRTVTQVDNAGRGRGGTVKSAPSVGRGVSPKAGPVGTKRTIPAGRGTSPGKTVGAGRGAATSARTITPPRTTASQRAATPTRTTASSGVTRLGTKRGSISSVSDTSSNNGTGKANPTGRSISPAGRGRPTNVKTTPARNFGSSPSNKGRGNSQGWNSSTIPDKSLFGSGRGKKATGIATSASAPGSRTQSPASGRSQIPTGRKSSTTTSPSTTAKSQIPAKRGSPSPKQSPGITRKPLSIARNPSSNVPSGGTKTPAGVERKGIPTLRSRSASPGARTSNLSVAKPNVSAPSSDKASESGSQGDGSPMQSPGTEEESDPPKLLKQSTFTKDKPSLPEQTPEMNPAQKQAAQSATASTSSDKLEDILSEAGSDVTSHSSGSVSISNGGWRRTSTASSAATRSGLTKPQTKPSNQEGRNVVTGNKSTSKQITSRTSSVPSKTPPSKRVASPSPKPQSRTSSTPAKVSARPSNVKPGNTNNSRTMSQNSGGPSKKTPPSSARHNLSKGEPNAVKATEGKTVANGSVKNKVANSPSSPQSQGAIEKERKSDLCREMGIPIQNKKGKVMSPSNDGIRSAGIWVKNEEDVSAQASEKSSTISRQSSVLSVPSSTSLTGKGINVSTKNLPNVDILMSNSSSKQDVTSPKESSSARNSGIASSDKEGFNSTEEEKTKSESSQGDKEEKKKKRFSFLKLKVGKKKKEAAEEKTKESKEKGKKKLFKKSKEKGKQTEDSETQTDNEENICADTDQSESIVDSVQSEEPARASFHSPDLNFDRRLDDLEDWDSDDDINNELMPDEFVEWDSENDISKEELPVFSETASEADPQSLEYRVNTSSPQHKAKLNGMCQSGSPTSKLADFSEESLRNHVRAESHLIVKGLRSLSLSEAQMDAQGEPSPPRPQRLRLPKKPFGMNRSETSPTSSAIPVLVSPFNYSPKTLKLNAENLQNSVGELKDKEERSPVGKGDGLTSPASLTRMTTV